MNKHLEGIGKIVKQVEEGKVTEEDAVHKIDELLGEGHHVIVETARIKEAALNEFQVAIEKAIEASLIKHPKYADEIWISNVDIDGQYYKVRVDISNLHTDFWEVNVLNGATTEVAS